NYGRAIDVEVGDGDYTFSPSFVVAYYDEPVTFIRIGTKTFTLYESDTSHCTKSERPDAFYAVLTDEQPRATFKAKNTGRNKFYIFVNKGCDFRSIFKISASENPDQPSK
ncbi:1453_t:CDS:2, partial [Funneliformis caledonium]